MVVVAVLPAAHCTNRPTELAVSHHRVLQRIGNVTPRLNKPPCPPVRKRFARRERQRPLPAVCAEMGIVSPWRRSVRLGVKKGGA